MAGSPPWRDVAACRRVAYISECILHDTREIIRESQVREWKMEFVAGSALV
jgi:hypothetical protein